MPTSRLFIALRILGLLFFWLAQQCLQPRNITMEVTAFDIYVMDSGSIFMELTSFSEFFFVTVRKNGSISVLHPDLEIRGGAVSKGVFSALRASVWSKNKGETQAPPLDPPLNFVCQGVNRRYICWLM